MRPSKFSNFIFNRNVQGTFYQAITLSIVILGVYYIVQNTAENMMARGLASGFHFLGVESQFDIGMTLIEYSPTSTYFDAFIVGLLNTLLVAGIGIFFSIFVGFIFFKRLEKKELSFVKLFNAFLFKYNLGSTRFITFLFGKLISLVKISFVSIILNLKINISTLYSSVVFSLALIFKISIRNSAINCL